MAPFDPDAIAKLGWRQGAVLGPALAQAARVRAPSGIGVAETDWLIVASRDCDLVNYSLEKEPVVEVLRAVIVERGAPDKQREWGAQPALAAAPRR